jgi:hypothetical protein
MIDAVMVLSILYIRTEINKKRLNLLLFYIESLLKRLSNNIFIKRIIII